MKKKYKSKFAFKNLQFKSLKSIQKFCYGLNIIEETNGIHECEIYIETPFICPWIDLNELNRTEMESLIQKMLKEIVAIQKELKDE